MAEFKAGDRIIVKGNKPAGIAGKIGTVKHVNSGTHNPGGFNYLSIMLDDYQDYRIFSSDDIELLEEK